MTTPEIWDALIRQEWRFEKGRPSSSDALDAVEDELAVSLPPGVRWLDQQPFRVCRRRLCFSAVQEDRNGLERVEVHDQPTLRSERVGEGLGEPHWWTRFGDEAVVEPWLSKFVVIAIDDYFGAYMLDFNFGAERPPVVYADWSEGSFPDNGPGGRLGYMQLVADSFENFLALPEWDSDREQPEFEPDPPSRRDEWAAWWVPRVAARYEELGIRPRSPW